jgi:2-dehydro-3-deoxyglucarate aldolase
MNRIEKIRQLREKLSNREVSVGSWIQLPDSSSAEIMGHAGYDWIALDLEHGSIGINQLPDLFRSLESGGTIPLVRIAQGESKDCKQALDAGAYGVIIPMVSTAEQLEKVKSYCCWPPSGIRGVGFSRANLFGKYFDVYSKEAQQPIIVAQIEDIKSVDNLESILSVDGLDAIIIGPYDLSASMKITAQFEHEKFVFIMNSIVDMARSKDIPCGIHVVQPDDQELFQRIEEGYKFIAYSIDSVFLNKSSKNPLHR